MKFAYPEFLYALSAIAIPIIIHLFNFRKFKKLYFSNVEFLKEVQQETQSRSKLKHLLVLLSRILANTFLVLAFAQPFVPIENSEVKSQEMATAIYIDNSFSMESAGSDGSLLNEAKNKAIEIINTHRSTDRFVILTNEFKATNQRLLSNEEAINLVESIQISATSRKLSDVYSRLRDALNDSEFEQKSCYLTSDFQKSTSDIKKVQADSSIASYLLPIQAAAPNNLFVDSCWFSSPTHLLGQNEELHVRIKNHSELDLENIPLKLSINKKSITPASFNVSANGSVTIQLNYRNKTSGIQQGKIELRDRPVTVDDHFYFSYDIAKNINVLNIGEVESDNKLKAVFQTDSIFNYTYAPVNQLDNSLIVKSDLVILSHIESVSSGLMASLKKYIDLGGTLYIIPPNKLDFNNYRELLSLLEVNYFVDQDTAVTRVKSINYAHPIYEQVFEGKPDGNLNLPVVNSHYSLSTGRSEFKTDILTLRNGEAFLAEYQVGDGTVYLNTSGLDKQAGNFANHALFVPTLYNMALLSRETTPLFFTIGSNQSLLLDRTKKDLVYHIKNERIDVIPPVQNRSNKSSVFVGKVIDQAGNYTIETEDYKGGLSFNYDRTESNLSYYGTDELNDLMANSTLDGQLINAANGEIKGALSELNIGKKYWKYCIILALLFLAAEVILIKLFKSS